MAHRGDLPPPRNFYSGSFLLFPYSRSVYYPAIKKKNDKLETARMECVPLCTSCPPTYSRCSRGVRKAPGRFGRECARNAVLLRLAQACWWIAVRCERLGCRLFVRSLRTPRKRT